MANPEHLAVLKQGVEMWNQWRLQQSQFHPDLSEADFRDANLRVADLSEADLSGAQMIGARLGSANLRRANLSLANLIGADITRANLSDANLALANLTGADLTDVRLTNTNFKGAAFMSTVLADVDLSDAIGLAEVEHRGPSTIGLDTLYRSQGRIPDEFLRNAGVPQEVIEHLLPLIRGGPPIQWHSCFISYSTKDEDFARRLNSRMREANMRVWFAPEDLEGGRKLHEQLFSAIQLNDKLLIVLSENSLQSEWVMTEIRKAREIERKENRRKLFPIRLVEFDTLRTWTCFDADSGKDLAIEVREYFIPDFSNWKNHDAFECAFGRLQKDLENYEAPAK